MARFLTRIIDGQGVWARPLGDFVHGIVNWLFHHMKPVHNFLNGTWLGHPLHALLTDVPIGAFTLTIVLDVANQRQAADIALVLGILSMLAAAVAGYADYADTDGLARQRATVHSTLMVGALVIYIVSAVLRWGNPVDRTAAIVTSIVAYLILSAGAYVGGDVVYALGNMVDRHAFRSRGTKWAHLDAPADVPEGVPTKAKSGAQTMVLVRRGDTVFALHDTCAHAGGPLSEGHIVDGCIECPWHGSRFDLATGNLKRGPSVYDQPRYEVRRTDTGWEARRAPG
ncbi:MAG TPA: Rieske 2Fe-2S domain-containing protein [Candidatus Saccharimonadales bacterium]|nr:Rieske 2Fe-2S domain-containing protein [Candidatus Saccharimonadales bacterium]